ncbi:hypothetical protein BSLG_007887 [Batrachochytrium salamandrivorans]|nr:hypothetical protein BSLG_007887 [Batrachochytrium salamandrivorans]
MDAPARSRKRSNSPAAESSTMSDDGGGSVLPVETDAAELADRIHVLETLVQSLEDRFLAHPPVQNQQHMSAGISPEAISGGPTLHDMRHASLSSPDPRASGVASDRNSAAAVNMNTTNRLLFTYGQPILDGQEESQSQMLLRQQQSSKPSSPLSLLPFTANVQPVVFNHMELDLINRLDLANRSVTILSPHMIFVTPTFLIRCIHECKALELSLYSLFLSGSLDLLDFPGRQGLAMRCYEAALYEIQHALESDSVATVLGLHSMALCSICSGMRAFIERARYMAVSIGLNDESRIQRIPSTPEDHNSCRGVWWGLCQLDWVYSFAWRIPPRIPDSQHLVRYPLDASVVPISSNPFELLNSSLSERDARMEVASNSIGGSFVVTKPGCGVAVSYLIIQRILSKIGLITTPFSDIQTRLAGKSQKDLIDLDQRNVLLEASLNGWWYAVPEAVRRFSQRVAAQHGSRDISAANVANRSLSGLVDELDITTPKSWLPVMILTMAYVGRILLRQDRWASAIFTNAQMASSVPAFRESLQAAFEASYLLSLVVHHRAYSLISPMIRVHLLELALFLAIANKMRLATSQDTARVQESLVTLGLIFNNTNYAWTETMTKVNSFILDLFSTIDDPVKVMIKADEIRVPPPSMYPDEKNSILDQIRQSSLVATEHGQG